MDPWTLAALVVAAFFAGFVDSIVGGGGIITLPALLATGMPPHLAIGTNKVVGTGASGIATWTYGRAGLLDRRLAAYAFPVAVGASIGGAATVLRLPEQAVLGMVAFVMVGIIAYVLARPRFGQDDNYPGRTGRVIVALVATAAVAGFYDGLLGPGTGTFLLFGIIGLTGMPFLRAAAHGRMLNFGSNVGALAYFTAAGTVDWVVGPIMAIGTVTGGFLGARFGVRYGARWLRPIFVVVASGLLVRLLWSLW